MSQNTSKHFCLAPWVHLHIWPNGQSFPCCMTPPSESVGNLKNQGMLEVWNSPPMKELRLNMLNDRPSKSCERCYQHEKIRGDSFRSFFNNRFRHHQSFVEKTAADGSLDKVNMAYMDIRFSNVCNFRCRTCGPLLSSSWYEDALKLDPHLKQSKRINLADNSLDFEKHWPVLLETVEEINFIGGEPLLMTEHWKILEELQKAERFDVRIHYNTNLSTLEFQGKNILDYWKNFKNIQVEASLDGAHEQGEYIRKGLQWSKIVENRKAIQQATPHVKFNVNATISNMNVGSILDFYEEWLALGYIQPEGMFFNLLLFPEHYQAFVLPPVTKQQVLTKLHQRLEKYRQEGLSFMAGQIESLISFIQQDFAPSLLDSFFAETEKLDQIRNESFSKLFPEFFT